jgi:glutamine synthetase
LKAIAQQHGLHVTFMPKPIAGINGSGMHTHQSLFNIKTGKNVFYDEKSEYKLSEIAMNYMAGILAHVQSMCAIMSPNVNSYKRLVPGFEAPVYLSWARINRSALIRIPRYSKGKTQATRCEVRCPDPSCNPYLAFAVMLKAGLDGIKKKLVPPEPIEEDVYEFTDEKLKELKIETLPATLGDALAVMQQDPLIKETLGEHTYEKFLESKQAEWDEYRLYVSQWELDKYLEVY